jgi:hypothetical protein
MPREEPSAPVEMVRPIQVQIELKPNPVSFSVLESEPRLEYDPRRDQGFGFSRTLATATERFDAGGMGTLELSLPGYYRAQFRWDCRNCISLAHPWEDIGPSVSLGKGLSPERPDAHS